jgi:hypothetical protein
MCWNGQGTTTVMAKKVTSCNQDFAQVLGLILQDASGHFYLEGILVKKWPLEVPKRQCVCPMSQVPLAPWS